MTDMVKCKPRTILSGLSRLLNGPVGLPSVSPGLKQEISVTL